MKDKLNQLTDAAINNLDQLNVQGVRNMHIIVETVKILDMLKQEINATPPETDEKEPEDNVQAETE